MSSNKINLELRELDDSSFNEIIKLQVFEPQKKCVATNVYSIAQASFNKNSWYRGIYVNDKAVGFIMLIIDHKEPEYFLWRFMIDKKYQGKGYGKIALDHVIKYLKQFPKAKVLEGTCHVGDDSPLNFYLKYGFTETEEWEDDEKLITIDIV
ncbi:MAG: GNAT family N-acetyltransferase [Spirochaetaceae bacterium]